MTAVRLREPSWDDLRVFLVVARALNMSAAARDLRVDRATASRRVAALERVLGARLFLRARTGLRLSAAGERVRAQAERMAEAAQGLAGRRYAEREQVAGTVRVATTEALAPFLVARGLLRVRERHPALSIVVAAGNKPLDLALGAADLALRTRPPTDAGLRVRRLAKMPLSVYAAPAYLAARGRPRPGDFSGHDVLVPSEELAALPEAAWIASQPGARVVFASNSLPALVAAACAEQGLIVLPRPWGDRERALVRCADVDDLAARALYLVLHPDAAERASVRVVADHIAAIVAGVL